MSANQNLPVADNSVIAHRNKLVFVLRAENLDDWHAMRVVTRFNQSSIKFFLTWGLRPFDCVCVEISIVTRYDDYPNPITSLTYSKSESLQI